MSLSREAGARERGWAGRPVATWSKALPPVAAAVPRGHGDRIQRQLPFSASQDDHDRATPWRLRQYNASWLIDMSNRPIIYCKRRLLCNVAVEYWMASSTRSDIASLRNDMLCYVFPTGWFSPFAVLVVVTDIICRLRRLTKAMFSTESPRDYCV